VSGRASVCSISLALALSLKLIASSAIDLAVSRYLAISSRADRRLSSATSPPRAFTVSAKSSSWVLRRAISLASSLPLLAPELRIGSLPGFVGFQPMNEGLEAKVAAPCGARSLPVYSTDRVNCAPPGQCQYLGMPKPARFWTCAACGQCVVNEPFPVLAHQLT